MNNWKVIPTIVLATVLIFGAGVFTGGFLVNSIKTTKPKKSPRSEAAQTNALAALQTTNSSAVQIPKPTRAPEFLSKEFLQRLDVELQLMPEQHDVIQKIINEGQREVKKAMNDARLEIRDVLKSDQVKQFDAMVKPNKKPADAPKKLPDGVLPVSPAVTNAQP